MASIDEAIKTLATRHVQYIEANYHLRNSSLIKERKRMMEEGVVVTPPWVEATPIYVSGKQLKDIGLPNPITNILVKFNQLGLGVFDPPYRHQADALSAFFIDNKDLIVSTGTSSGKTEIFLYSILGSLAMEAERKKTTLKRGFRAIILYPMNALVADQLSRLRRLFGSDKGSEELESLFSRRIQFGMYTSRTPYHGEYNELRNDRLVKPLIDYYCSLQLSDPDLFEELQSRGRIPAKELEGFRNRHHPKNTQYRTQPTDSELFTRQEMHSEKKDNKFGGTPDILITNYSMLEYMLLRPIEQPLFYSTREWLASDKENQLIVVIDEAHLYRGAQGAEVALLIQRLLQHLRIPRSRVRFILTSASLGTNERALSDGPSFAAELTGSHPDQFKVILGTRRKLDNGAPGTKELANILININYRFGYDKIAELAKFENWIMPSRDGNENALKIYLCKQLLNHTTFRFLHNILKDSIQPLKKLAKETFPEVEDETAVDATLNLLFLSSQSQLDDGQNLFPVRIHMFFKGLPKQYICINPKCTYRREKDPINELLGKMYTEPRFLCDCGARVFELLSHRTCGAAYLKAFRRQGTAANMEPVFLWTEAEGRDDMEEIHILVESPRSDPDMHHPQNIPLSLQTQNRYLDINTGHLIRTPPKDKGDRFIKVWVPGDKEAPGKGGGPWSWTRCPACGIRERRRIGGQTNIMDLETKGEETFANLVRTLFQFQPEVTGKEKLPNKGRKVLCFSDGRQKAARLARDLQRTVELDSFREVVVKVLHELSETASLSNLFPAIIYYTSSSQIAFFDDGDEVEDVYPGSRTRFVEIQRGLGDLIQNYNLSSKVDIVNDRDIIEHLNNNRPRRYNTALLRLLGDKFYSIRAALVAYLSPTDAVFNQIKQTNLNIDPNLLREILLEVLRYAAEERAFDPAIDDRERRGSRATTNLPFGHERYRGECLTLDEIIPDDIRKRVGDRISNEQWTAFSRSLIRSSASAEKLFSVTSNNRYAINPASVILRLSLDKPWYRCIGCWQFFVSPLADKCPECGAPLEELQMDDPHMIARKSLFRDPCIEVVSGSYIPFTIRSEEHSAQLSHRDYTEAFSKTEEYELLFQDIILNDKKVEQPIDVLSCTTTMEVGIDIGSLTAVALRTVPPRPENYQQRSGRAGRRSSALSTIITFADNSPHESFHFSNPELMIGAPSSKLSIYVGNLKINERHINASLLQRFFHRGLEADTEAPQLHQNADVFSSLGLSRDFFQGGGDYSLREFGDWIQSEVLPENSKITNDVSSLLPGALQSAIGMSEYNWREQFVRETAKQFLSSLEDLSQKVDWNSVEEEETNLLSTLLDAALLPTFSFPIDVCTFSVQKLDRDKYKVRTLYEMTQELRQALSEYIPGRQVVVDKKTFTSRGIYFPFTNDPVNRASVQDWDRLDWLNYCTRCDTILEEFDRNMSSEGARCRIPNCNGEIRSQRIFRPPGFSPEVDPFRGALEGERREEERIYATSAKYPLPVTTSRESKDEHTKELKRGIARRMPNQKLLVVNFGPNNEGFEICMQCGTIGGNDGLRTPHNRPYPHNPQVKGISWPRQCSGSPVRTTLGYNFRTDLTVLRFEMRSPLNSDWEAQWFKSAIKSLTEALVIGAARALGIDSTELAGGYRLLPRFSDDEPSINSYIEIFLYDTTPAGAGFALKFFENLQEALDATMNILSNCKCSQSCHACLRTYNNRIDHNVLDRHLAKALLNYVTTGELPRITSEQNKNLANLLQLTLSLMEPNIQFMNVESNTELWQVSLASKHILFTFKPCLIEPMKTPSEGVDLEIPDFNIYHNLPGVAHEILDRVR